MCVCVNHLLQTSLKSEMQNISFEHIHHFRHRHFQGSHHDFNGQHREEFLDILATDMAVEASHAAFGTNFAATHKHPAWDADVACTKEANIKVDSKQKKMKPVKKMPKHFYIDDFHRSDYDRGRLGPLDPRPRLQLNPSEVLVDRLRHLASMGH